MVDEVFVSRELLSFEQWREQYKPDATFEGIDPRVALMLLPSDVWSVALELYGMGFEPTVSTHKVMWEAYGWDCCYLALPVTQKYEQIFHTGFAGQDSRNRRYSGEHKRLDQLMADVRHYSAIDARLNEQARKEERKASMTIRLYMSGNGNPPGVKGAHTNSSTLWLLVDGVWYHLPNYRSKIKARRDIEQCLDLLGACPCPNLPVNVGGVE